MRKPRYAGTLIACVLAVPIATGIIFNTKVTAMNLGGMTFTQVTLGPISVQYHRWNAIGASGIAVVHEETWWKEKLGR